MNIAVVGTGYVGLVSGVCLSSKGHNVTCVDIREDIVSKLNRGEAHIYEKNLDELLLSVINKGIFRATSNLFIALENADLVLLAVGTPSIEGKINLNQITEACKQIAIYIKNSNRFISIVVKSTVVPATTDTYVKGIIEQYSGKKLGEFGLGMNPEFLKEGDAIDDFMYPDRIVIGYEDEKTKEYLDAIYEPWTCDKLYVNSRTAEMIKYANNTILACMISMNNELANLATKISGIDYLDVIKGVSLDKRWSPMQGSNRVIPPIISYFTPGAGFGGSCFPKDVQAIRAQGEQNNLAMHMTNAILNTNEEQPYQVLENLRSYSDVIKKKILFLGLAFKPNTDDVRESSSLKILKLLLENNFKVLAHDPVASPNALKELSHPNLNYIDDWASFVDDSEVIIIGTNWEEYLKLKSFLKPNLSPKIIYDCKRLFSANEITGNIFITFGKA